MLALLHFYQCKIERNFYELTQLDIKRAKRGNEDLIAENLINTNGLDKTECFFNNNFLETYRQNVMSNTDLFIVVLDSFTAQPWLNPSGGLYGSINTHGSRSYKAFAFKTALSFSLSSSEISEAVTQVGAAAAICIAMFLQKV